MAHENSRAKGFWDDQDPHYDHVVTQKLMLIVCEVSEGCEEVRKGEPDLYYNFVKPDKPEGLASELADIIIRTCDLAEARGIDLTEVIKLKHAYNQTRPVKHGKAF
jgi:NTP pyrophosphatase (non-canonical NTP hydrolase)